MNLYVFFLVLFAAFSHAGWNFFSKKSSGNLKVTIAGVWVANLTLLPVSLIILFHTGLDPRAIFFMIITSFSHILYYWSLAKGYRSGDISTVYPVARGIGVAGTAVFSFFLLGENISLKGWSGILFIVSGVLFVTIRSGFGINDLKALKYAVLVGISIVIYSVNDKIGVSYANPVVYINLKDILALVIMTPFLFRTGKREIIETLKNNSRSSLIIGYGALGTYLLILYAFTMERAGYVSAVREFSVVIGSVLGFIFLGEKLTLRKAAGIIMVVGGLVFIKLA